MFRSFFLAGFECATGYNVHGEWIDQIAATQHDRLRRRRLPPAPRGRASRARARPSAGRWSTAAGRYDFAAVRAVPRRRAAPRHRGRSGISSTTATRTTSTCSRAEFPGASPTTAARRRVTSRAQTDGPHYFTPVNEPSYFAWAAGDAALFAPHQRGRGCELKVAAGARRDPRASRRSARRARTRASSTSTASAAWCRPRSARARGRRRDALQRATSSSRASDMLAGRLPPGARRQPRAHLDMVGINYYWTNQWELGREGVPLADDDPRRMPLARAGARRLAALRRRRCWSAETGALDDERAPWLAQLADRAGALLERACRCAASACIRSWACRSGTRGSNGRAWASGTSCPEPDARTRGAHADARGASRGSGELREHLLLVEVEEALLIRADLVDVDVVEARLRGLFGSSRCSAGIGAAEHGTRDHVLGATCSTAASKSAGVFSSHWSSAPCERRCGHHLVRGRARLASRPSPSRR